MSEPDHDHPERSDASAQSPPTKGSSGGRRLDRRTFLKGGLIAGGTLLGGALAVNELAQEGGKSHGSPAKLSAPAPAPTPARIFPRSAATRAPNILVIVVDQMRSSPRWISAAPIVSGLLPNIGNLAREGVSFASHYTASNDCTPARSTLLTGLYTHQTGCMITGGSTLDPGFPTWGSMLREHGYKTYWYGKWHLTHHDNKWTVPRHTGRLEQYGFSGGTYPSPDGAPGQGWRVDPFIVSQFKEWLAENAHEEPWCTTVSLVNPHDIAWWYTWTDRVAAEARAPAVTRRMPINFETPELLVKRDKPRLQLSLQEPAAESFGAVPFEGPGVRRAWLTMLDLYAKLQHEVDRHVGSVLQALQSHPEVAENTIVVFTSDHGEYGGAHGLRGKGAAAYEEGIRVPLIVKDPRAELTAAHGRLRNQLTSSVDIAPLLLSIASGSEQWRREARYEHLADRLDLMRILEDPSAPGRTHVLHSTDEVLSEFSLEPYAANAPLHVLAVRTHRAKLVTYSDWKPGTIEPIAEGAQTELYDYRARSGRLELHNDIEHSSIEAPMRAMLTELYRREMARPLHGTLAHASRKGFDGYFSTAKSDARGAAAARLRRAERQNRGPAIDLGSTPASQIEGWSKARHRAR
jgi:arylsulfatase A-like enzyme